MSSPDIWFLAEMMNSVGVVNDDKEIMDKIQSAIKVGKPIDGHAPLLSGEQLDKYVNAGISTDHECTNIEEAEEKISKGMKILIREGSAARDFDALYPLIDKYPNEVMLCTDDCHPDELMRGHINVKVKKAIELGVDLFKILQVACLNPVKHYKIPVGTLNVGDAADFIIVDDWRKMNVEQVYINGNLVFDEGKTLFESSPFVPINNFSRNKVSIEDIALNASSENIKVMVAKDGELLTDQILAKAKIENGKAVSDIENDILKIVVFSRYDNTKPGIGFIKGIGIKMDFSLLCCS